MEKVKLTAALKDETGRTKNTVITLLNRMEKKKTAANCFCYRFVIFGQFCYQIVTICNRFVIDFTENNCYNYFSSIDYWRQCYEIIKILFGKTFDCLYPFSDNADVGFFRL